ncbi:MAG: GTP cyclohydrolase FolE2 [Nannocystaceae bacterium]
MKDIQGSSDHRQIAIDRVGVSDVRHPIVVLDRANEKQHTIATLTMSVDLPHHFKGTHMSRFIEVLNEHHGEVTMRTLPTILGALRDRLEAESAHIEVSFPYFSSKAAPVSGATALMDYECAFIGESTADREDFILQVKVPVTSLCPCSKAISDYGAHNQRGHVTIQVRSAKDDVGAPQLVWIEELIAVAEASASAPVYPLLKRSDERHVTMQAYDNPVFVEDMVRNVAARLQDEPRVGWFHVHAVNHESIHNHGAFAALEWTRPEHE